MPYVGYPRSSAHDTPRLEESPLCGNVRVGIIAVGCIAQLGAKAWCDTCHRSHDLKQSVLNALSIDGRGGYPPPTVSQMAKDGRGVFLHSCKWRRGQNTRDNAACTRVTPAATIAIRHQGSIAYFGKAGYFWLLHGRRCEEVHDSKHRANLYKRLRNERRRASRSLRLSCRTIICSMLTTRKNNR